MSEGKLLYGQQYDRTRPGQPIIQFIEQISDIPTAVGLLGQAATEITPTDGNASLVRVYSALASSFENYSLRVAGVANFSLPNVLTGLSVTWNTSGQNAETIKQAGMGIVEGTSGSLNAYANSTAQGSAGVIPDLVIEVTEYWTQNVPVEHLFFYLSGNVTRAQILARATVILSVAGSVSGGIVTVPAGHGLAYGQEFQFSAASGASGGLATNTTYYVAAINDSTHFTYSATLNGLVITTHNATSVTVAPTVFPWPSFRPQSHTIVLKGKQVSLSQNAESKLSESFSSDSRSLAINPWLGSRSDGYSVELGLSVKTYRIPPTIHPAITLSNTTQTASTTVTVKANLPSVWNNNNGLPNIPSVINEPTPITSTLEGSVTPTSLAATSVTAIPVAGFYVLSYEVDTPNTGYSLVHVVIVDMSYYA